MNECFTVGFYVYGWLYLDCFFLCVSETYVYHIPYGLGSRMLYKSTFLALRLPIILFAILTTPGICLYSTLSYLRPLRFPLCCLHTLEFSHWHLHLSES